MGTIVYKPYKRKLNQWKCLSENIRTDKCGREIVPVEIGKTLYMNGEKIEKEEEILEDIYLDIVTGIFANRDSYHTTICLGYEPQIVVSYEGALVIHNDKMSGYVDKILKILDKVEYSEKVKVLVHAVEHEVKGNKYTTDMKKLQDYIKKESGISFSPELIGYVLKENLCENRVMTDKQEELHWMAYEELLEKAGTVLAARDKGKAGSRFEYDVMNELLYRFIGGQFSERA